MNHPRPRSRPAVPSAVLAAAVLLSLSSTADVTVAAVLMNAGRQLPARATEAESLGQWLSRFTDAARQMRDAFSGDEASLIGQVQAALPGHADKLPAARFVAIALDQQDHLPHASPMRAALTDLPPPAR